MHDPISQSAPTPLDTGGLTLRHGQPWLRQLVELLSAMRFAISALSIVCLASAIGTIVPQSAPELNYINQFGVFWAELFQALGLFRVYNASWFLLVMLVLLVSVSLCVLRTTPKLIKEVRAWRDQVPASTFPAFSHRYEQSIPAGQGDTVLSDWQGRLARLGYQIKVPQAAEPQAEQSSRTHRPRLVGRKGGMGRLGYIGAHLSIVIISLGGLLDSELPADLAAKLRGITPLQLSSLVGQEVPERLKLSPNTLSYRGNLFLPEAQVGDIAVVNRQAGAYLVELPFELTLKRFLIDYYSTGMPKRFASEVVLKDKRTGEVREETIEVNKPLIHRGIAVYQASFDDGGSQLTLKTHALGSNLQQAGEQTIRLKVGEEKTIQAMGQTLGLELVSFKPISVENIGPSEGDGGSSAEQTNEAKTRPDPFQTNVASVISPAAKTQKGTGPQNVGPSFIYRLRDGAGQSTEFQSYMLPIALDGERVFIYGARANSKEPFSYLRIPADEQDSLTEYLRLRRSLNQPELVRSAAARFAGRQASGEGRMALQATAEKTLNLWFQGGGEAILNSLQEAVPEAQRARAQEILVQILRGSFWEYWQLVRRQAGLSEKSPNASSQAYADAVLSVLPMTHPVAQGSPFLPQLTDFDEVKASVLQVTRSPGQSVVYLGSLFLILGVFGMLYLHERRVWVWLTPGEAGATVLRVAASSPRASLDFDQEFQRLISEKTT